MKIRVKVNGQLYESDVEPRTLLAYYLRDELKLTGTHIGCDTTSCGACTVLLDGKAVKSCTVFAVQADGREVLTVEGLEKRRRNASVAESILGGACVAVRLLYTRHANGFLRTASGKSSAD